MATTAPTYPCLTRDSIEARCRRDLTKFEKIYGFVVSGYSLPSGPAGTVEELKSRIKKITDQISTISKNRLKSLIILMILKRLMMQLKNNCGVCAHCCFINCYSM